MAPRQFKSRIHLLAAKDAARIVVIQRKRSKLFHVFIIDTVKCRIEHGYTFSFTLTEYPDLLKGATWATWDILGNLWVTRPGLVERYKLGDIKRGIPSFSIDIEPFEPPARERPEAKTPRSS